MLTQKQLDLIANVLQYPTFAAAIKATGISSKTAYKWKNENKEFIAELNRVKLETLDSVSVYLQSSLIRCSDELMKIVKDEKLSPQVRINAISLIFQNARTLTEQVDILKRIMILETAASERGEENES